MQKDSAMPLSKDLLLQSQTSIDFRFGSAVIITDKNVHHCSKPLYNYNVDIGTSFLANQPFTGPLSLTYKAVLTLLIWRRHQHTTLPASVGMQFLSMPMFRTL